MGNKPGRSRPGHRSSFSDSPKFSNISAEGLLAARQKLSREAPAHTLETLLQGILDEVCQLTESPIGFCHLVEPDQKMVVCRVCPPPTIIENCAVDETWFPFTIDADSLRACFNSKETAAVYKKENQKFKSGNPL